MRKKEIHEQLFFFIEEFNKPKQGLLIKKNSPINKLKAHAALSKKDFSIDFEWDRFSKENQKLHVGQYYKKIGFQSENHAWILEDFYLERTSSKVSSENNTSSHYITAKSAFTYTKGYSKKTKYYYRLVIPLSNELNFHWLLSETKVMFGNDILEFITTQDHKQKYYLIIESKLKQCYDLFSEKTFALKTALGYLSGYFAGDGGYFVAYTKRKMELPVHVYRCQFRDSIISQYTPIWSNPHGYIRNENLAAKYYNNNILRCVSLEELSVLCQRIYNSDEFSSALILILESSVASLLFMPGGYAIVLETLADIIKPAKKPKVAPMSKSLSKKVRQECSDIIEKYKGEISKDNYKALLDRIDWLNQATNKAKLKAPFDYLEINLLEKDLDILDSRNDFLHGRVPDITKVGKSRSLERQNKDLYYASMRFYTLLNILILKWIGYDNYVVNYPKINESYTGIKLKEQPYRQV